MDKRLRFRYRWWTIKSACRTPWGRPCAALELQRLTTQDEGGKLLEAEVGGSPRVTKDNSVDPRGQEKPQAGRHERPYRRPTQVGRSENSQANG